MCYPSIRSERNVSMKRIIVFLLALMTALFMLAGCGTENASQGNQSATRVVKDIDGTDVTIPKDITKVADLWHANNQVVLMLGGADKLVSTTTSVQGLPWFAKVYPRIKEIPAPVKGTDVQMEEIQKLKPQVVLASNKNQIEMARNAGIPAVRVNFQDYDGLRKVINITAEVLGDKAPEMAKQYLAYLDGKIKFAEAKALKNHIQALQFRHYYTNLELLYDCPYQSRKSHLHHR